MFLWCPVKLTEALSLFLVERKSRGCGKCAMLAYTQHCTLFVSWLAEQGVVSVGRLRVSHVEKFIADLRERDQLRRDGKLSPVTIWKRMKHIKTFLMWLMRRGDLAQEVIYSFPMPKVRKRLPKALSPEQVRALLGVKVSVRDRAVLVLMLDAGLRVSEVAGLALDDIDFERGQVHVRHGKGDKERYALFGSSTAMSLRCWLGVRRSETSALFVDRFGRGLKSGGVYKLVKRIARAAGLRVHPHQLRHTFATEWLDAGGSITDLQLLMGHEHLSTTMIYGHVALGRVRERFQSLSLVNRLTVS